MKDEKQHFIDGFNNGWSQGIKRMMDLLLDVKSEIYNTGNQAQINNMAVEYFNKLREGKNAEKKEK